MFSSILLGAPSGPATALSVPEADTPGHMAADDQQAHPHPQLSCENRARSDERAEAHLGGIS
jgi:hypothetical protein